MKRLLLASLAGATALATVTPAQAHPNWHYEGGCDFTAVSDGTDSPHTEWDGEIDVWAVATDASGIPAPNASITVDCELLINGWWPGTVVFSCSTPGTGSVGCAGQFSFTADPDDVVTMCDNVTVNGEVHKNCPNLFWPPLVPHPVREVTDEVICLVTDEIEWGPLDDLPPIRVRVGDRVPYGDADVGVGYAEGVACAS